MQEYRKVYAAYPGHVLEKRRGTSLRRVLGPETIAAASSFLLLEVLTAKDTQDVEGGFPWRPYKGIECITYFIDTEESLRDASAGRKAWLCAGDGEIQEKIPAMDTPVVGMQLWAALDPEASTDSFCPGFTDVPAAHVEGTEVRVIAGSCGDLTGALPQTGSGVTFLDVYIPPHGVFTYRQFASDRLVTYIIEGEAYFEADKDELFPENRALVMTEGECLEVSATHRGVRFVLLHAPSDAAPVLKMSEIRKSEDDWTELLES